MPPSPRIGQRRRKLRRHQRTYCERSLREAGDRSEERGCESPGQSTWRRERRRWTIGPWHSSATSPATDGNKASGQGMRSSWVSPAASSSSSSKLRWTKASFSSCICCRGIRTRLRKASKAQEFSEVGSTAMVGSESGLCEVKTPSPDLWPVPPPRWRWTVCSRGSPLQRRRRRQLRCCRWL